VGEEELEGSGRREGRESSAQGRPEKKEGGLNSLDKSDNLEAIAVRRG